MTNNPFWKQTDLTPEIIQPILDESLHGTDDGELYLEHSVSEGFVFDDGRLKSVSSNIDTGFGLRSVVGDLSAYAHSNDLTLSSLKQMAGTVSQIGKGHDGKIDHGMIKPSHQLYLPENALQARTQKQKTDLLEKIDAYAREKNSLVTQVSTSISGKSSAIQIMKQGGFSAFDMRPMVRLTVQVTVEKNGRTEQGYSGGGGRFSYDKLFEESFWQHHADEALRQALVNLEAKPAPAGEMSVVLGSGWPGVLLHEAVGHGLEGDFNRKGVSVYSGRIGEQVAAKGVTVIDEGNIENKRGSLHFDDEGTPTQKNVLIEDGILVGYMQDRMNARLMGVNPTGNGRRESYAHLPMPRMTNTYMDSGNHTQEEMIASVQNGIYAPNFGGGSVDITSGQFVFEMTEAYLIENGKVTAPIKGATLIGNGPQVMQKITMVGNDSALDEGTGVCGKSGQSVPVCVGQPSLKIEKITVGGNQV